MKRGSADQVSPTKPEVPPKKSVVKKSKFLHGREGKIAGDGHAVESDSYLLGSFSVIDKSPPLTDTSRSRRTAGKLQTRYLTVTRNRKTKMRQLHKVPRNVAPSLFHLLSHLLLPKRNPTKKGNL